MMLSSDEWAFDLSASEQLRLMLVSAMLLTGYAGPMTGSRMNSPNLSAPITARPDSKLGIAMRVLFFVAAVWVASSVIGASMHAVLHSPILVATIGTFATGLLANLLTLRIFDRRNLVDIGLGNAPGSGRNFLIGLALGAGAATLVLGLPVLAQVAHIVPRPEAEAVSLASWGASLLLFLTVLLFGAAGEEAIFRGYAFQLLVDKMGAFATVLPVGVLFGIAHAANPNTTKLALFNTALWGVLLGCAFLRSHDLWLPIALHYSWNAVLPVFGTDLSGITIEVTRYTYRWDLGPAWSGGAYGPEGGLLTTIVIALLFFALWKAPIVPQVAAIAKALNER